MAIVATAVVNRPTYKSWTLACLDADTGPTTFAHGFGAGLSPDEITIMGLTTAGQQSFPQANLSGANISITKTNVAGSGNAGAAAFKVVAKTPHSIL